MNKNVKAIIIIVVLLVIAYFVYRMVFSSKAKFNTGYAKKPGEWVACQVQDFDKKYYQGNNTAGVTIYFKKDEVRTRPAKDATIGLCADAKTNMNVYTLKA